MRSIKYLVVHCTATPTSTTVKSIQNYWKYVLGWHNPGYHYIISYDGTITQLLDDSKVANGVKGYNTNSIHLSYIGGVGKDGKALDTRSLEQEISILKLLLHLKVKYPDAEILGHRDFPHVYKDCPSFDVKDWLSCKFS